MYLCSSSTNAAAFACRPTGPPFSRHQRRSRFLAPIACEKRFMVSFRFGGHFSFRPWANQISWFVICIADGGTLGVTPIGVRSLTLVPMSRGRGRVG